MRDQMRKALDFAISKEKEAEAFYKEWAAAAKDPAVHGLFAELAGVEHGHMEILSQITPEEMASSANSAALDLGLSDLLVDVAASPGLNLQEAMIVAMKREECAVKLYSRLAELNGEARSLFEALAKEEGRHKAKLEAEYDDHILTEN
ncbi:ferritin family protein [Candidatus Bipolaricaulota bacterium]|nr:ferritin family protein [Candidatus Bipolaricaulota bacterium]